MKKNVKNLIKFIILSGLALLMFTACEDLFKLLQDPETEAEVSPSPAPELTEDCVDFNNATIEVVEIDGRWKIVDGSHWIKDFAGNEAEARKAFDIFKFYNINSQCFVGRPDPSLTYLLSNGQAPVGEYPGEDAVAFNPDNIEVVQIEGRWKIVEGSHWILDFESNEAEAREAFAIIKHYGFEYICFVGRPDASLVYFRKAGAAPTATSIPEQTPTPPTDPFLTVTPVPQDPDEDCVGFNNATIEVVEIEGRWKIVDGTHWIMDFEDNEAEARKAFDILKFYNINSQCFVGRPDPSLTYLLSNGQAPVGEYPGEDAVAFNPDNIEVVQIEGRWKIVEGSHWILDFESNEAEAREAFAIIKHYGFEYISFVGRPDASLVYFRKAGAAPTITNTPAPTPTLIPLVTPTIAVINTPTPTIGIIKPTIGPITTLTPVPQELDEDCVSFDNATIEVVEMDGRWKIVDGSHSIRDFDTNEAEARKAFDIFKFYGINSRCFVGRPDPSFTYLLSNGQPPVGEYPGEDAVAFNPDNIEVVQIEGRWKIVEGSHWILDFESNEAEAREAFAIIKHYGFEYICFVGRPDASLIYFRKDSVFPVITTIPPEISPTLPPIIIKPL